MIRVSPGGAALQSDGSAIVGLGPDLRRFTPGGTLDPRWSDTVLEDFDPPACGVYELAPWTRGGVLVVHTSCSSTPVTVRAIDLTGEPDTVLPDAVAVANSTGAGIANPRVDATGRTLIEIGQPGQPRLVRLLQDGSPDPSFVSPTGSGGTVAERGVFGRLLRGTAGPPGTQRLSRYLPGDPPAPLPVKFTSSTVAVNGSYAPVPGDFNGDGISDVLWYAPGSAGDSLWYGKRAGGFTSQAVSIAGSYVPVPGDYDGDGDTDLILYGPGTKPDKLWRPNGSGGFAVSTLTVNGKYQPIPGDFNGDRLGDVIWYAPGTASDVMWSAKPGGGFSSSSISLTGTFTPVPGDYDGNGRTDIIWYAPGTATDALWLAKSTGGFASSSLAISGSYRPLVGDLNGDELDDVVWYGGNGPDSSWLFRHGGGFRTQAMTLGGGFVPVPGDVNGDGLSDILWYGPGTAPDRVHTTGIL